MLTDMIAEMIERMLNESNGMLELQRNEMADKLGCVPSQISYVIASRFTPERGYVIESHRGGGGCIKIVKKAMGKHEYLMHFFCAIGNEIDENETRAYIKNLMGNGIISENEALIAYSSLSGSALGSVPIQYRNHIRADIFKQIILSQMKNND